MPSPPTRHIPARCRRTSARRSRRQSRTPRSARRCRPPTVAWRRPSPPTPSPTCSMFRGLPPCSRTRWSSRRMTTPSSSARRPSGPRSAAPRRPARTSSSASSTRASGPSIRCSRRLVSRLRKAASRAAVPSSTSGDAAHLGPAFACNNKLIGAYAFTNTYMAILGADEGQEFCNNSTDVCSPRDSEGHGTHTLTTAVGDCVASAVIYSVERGPVCGIAPGAHVIAYRVCLRQGCFGSDSLAAVQQAIRDGVDVINFSISGGGTPVHRSRRACVSRCLPRRHLGQRVGRQHRPGAGTSGHGGPWVTTVGASTGPREFRSTLHLTADGRRVVRPGRASR